MILFFMSRRKKIYPDCFLCCCSSRTLFLFVINDLSAVENPPNKRTRSAKPLAKRVCSFDCCSLCSICSVTVRFFFSLQFLYLWGNLCPVRLFARNSGIHIENNAVSARYISVPGKYPTNHIKAKSEPFLAVFERDK